MNLFMGVDSSNPYNIFAKVILKKYESKNLKKIVIWASYG